MLTVIDRSGSTWHSLQVDNTPQERERLARQGYRPDKEDGERWLNRINVDEVLRAAGDVRQFIARDLGEPVHKNGRVWMYKCPLHGERNGEAFAVYPDGWRCFGRCDRSGDAISWLVEYHGLDFEQACNRIMGSALPPEKRPTLTLLDPPRYDPPPNEWQKRAERLVAAAASALWECVEARHALNYLRGRGFEDWIIKRARFGYVAAGEHDHRDMFGLWTPGGITIPWFCNGELWAINVRRLSGQPKYKQVAGGNIRGALFGADYIVDGLPLVFVEGEFDRWITWQTIGAQANVVTLGGASNHLHERWYELLNSAPRVYVLTDSDGAGNGAADKLLALRKDAKRVTTPGAKDANALVLADRYGALMWMRSALA